MVRLLGLVLLGMVLTAGAAAACEKHDVRGWSCGPQTLTDALPRVKRHHRATKVAKARPKPSAKVVTLVLPPVLAAFAGPVGVVCAPVVRAAGNLLHAFAERLAQIVEPVRPGYVEIRSASGARAVVAQSIAPKFVDLLRALEATGYRIKEMGGYSYRRIAGTRTLSKHAFGMAIDINQLARDRVSVPMDRRLASRLARASGLCSGGDWRNGDLGHFEACGRPSRIRTARL